MVCTVLSAWIKDDAGLSMYVFRGQAICRPAGGSSTSNHIHFSLSSFVKSLLQLLFIFKK